MLIYFALSFLENTGLPTGCRNNLLTAIREKIKSFFAGMFGFAGFYSYIFIREKDLLAGGETGWLSKRYQDSMFSAGRENGS